MGKHAVVLHAHTHKHKQDAMQWECVFVGRKL